MAGVFSAQIDVIGVNPYVGPPDDVLDTIFKEAGKNKSPIPVKGTINGAAFEQSLVRYSGDWRLYINGAMAKRAGLTFSGSIARIVGEQITISMVFNPEPMTYGVVPEFQEALDKNAGAHAAFEQLTPGRQKEILRYLGSLKTSESRQRNTTRLLRHLHGEETDALYALVHRKPKQ